MIYQNINLDINPGGFPAIVRVSQYDTFVGVIATILRNGQVLPLDAGMTAKVEGTKPSGLGFSFLGSVNNAVGAVLFQLPATATEEAGDIPCEIVLTNTDNFRIGTANFVLAVEQSPHPKGTLDGDTESARTLVEQMQIAVLAAQTAAASVNPQTVTSAETEPSLEADGRYIYVYTNPLTAIDITPASAGVTSVFFETGASTCTLTLPAAVMVPPGLNVTADASGQAVELPAGLNYELNIFNNRLLIEAWT